jgi:hypothetical protein
VAVLFQCCRMGAGGAQAPTPEPRDVLGIAGVVCRCAAMEGLHGEGRPKDAGKACLGTEVSQPGIREETLDRDDTSLPRRC